MRNNIPVTNIYDIVDEVHEILLARSQNPELPITSLPSLNKKIWGLRRARLTIIGARPSHGKSAFALQIAIDQAKQNKAVLYLSLEMTKDEIIERLICNNQHIDNFQLLIGNAKDYEIQISDFKNDIRELRLAVSDCIGKTWEEINDYLENLTVKPDVVILDYLQAVKKSSRIEKDSLDEYIRNFREMAIRNNFAGILCSQINRSTSDPNQKDKNPQLHQLKGTGVLEEHADVIILLYWPYKNGGQNINHFQIEVAKNRNGRTGFINLKFTPEFYLFEDVDPQTSTQQNIDWQD